MIIASNFKANHTRASTKLYMETLKTFLVEQKINQDVMVFPPATALDSFELPSNALVGAQNCHPVLRGSFTGELGLEHLNEFDITTVLLGHSERRHIMGESLELIASKYDFFKKANMKIVLCVGEPLEVKQEGFDATMKYLRKQCEGLDLNYENLVVAYEPVWAIGTGLTAQSREIGRVHTALREIIKSPLLYGGSVTLCTLENILRTENVDGVLVGTASWNVEEFCKMIEMAEKITKGENNGNEGKEGSNCRSCEQ
jgi:triosephosphate isomerase